MSDAQALNRGMLQTLRAAGQLTDPRVEAAMQAVPRHLFAPATGWLFPDHDAGPDRVVNRQDDPDGWWSAVYTNGSIVTQRDDGACPVDSPEGVPSSSLSAAGIVAEFLQLLEVRPGARVLEVGTGTGWTAALLARMGAEVTSVEIDPAVAERAAANLKTTGHTPRLVVGDGAQGWPDGAPYDRVHATCSVNQVPYAWVAQTRPGGVIVTPWQPGAGHGWQLRLQVEDERAVGRFQGPAGFMMLRAQRTVGRWNPHHADDAASTRTRLDPRAIADAGPGLTLAVSARCPGAGMLTVPDDDGSLSVLLFEIGAPDGSWAACDYEPGDDDFEVTQYGDRRLWDEVAAAFAWWDSHGRPGPERFGLAMSSQGQRLWLNDPNHPITPISS
ncbi:methyltransferase domain-containing protein [Actinomadura rubrisoli]|uniref:Protein-L-isoaspartate O-methyltransferase n=1 Tax=Actinomadura rubrisoli TaxID=2530368 RepID=A0A4V2YW72_9ACTN|nr:methyltransferase domain-containing protein [Actinomadura rubrisoli]TDD84317.1 methyltransferase domain-containing protein [Actinomadura rubrisoli]